MEFASLIIIWGQEPCLCNKCGFVWVLVVVWWWFMLLINVRGHACMGYYALKLSKRSW